MKNFDFPVRPPKVTVPMKKLGEGGFGSVFLINDRIVAKAVLMDKPVDELSFNMENMSWKILSQIPELKDNIPHYMGWSMYKYNDVAPHTREFKDKQAPSAVGVIYQKYIPVKTLADFIQYPSPLIPYRKGRELFDNLIRAFNALHARGFVHRDIKPQNVLIRTGGGPLENEPIIIDVGMLCKTPCKAKGLAGTLPYMPRNFFPAEMREEHLGSTPKFNVAERPVPPIADRLAYFVARRLGRESAHPVKPTRKAVRVVESPTSVLPNYTPASDNYALALTLESLVAYIEITEESIEGIEIMNNIITKMKGEVIAEMAAAIAARRFPRPNFVDPRPGGSKRKSRRSRRRRGTGTRRRKD
jgi:serine/threonine protein kinase